MHVWCKIWIDGSVVKEQARERLHQTSVSASVGEIVEQLSTHEWTATGKVSRNG